MIWTVTGEDEEAGTREKLFIQFCGEVGESPPLTLNVQQQDEGEEAETVELQAGQEQQFQVHRHYHIFYHVFYTLYNCWYMSCSSLYSL
jgi:hypothetical protein